jgi:hypothetical protein
VVLEVGRIEEENLKAKGQGFTYEVLAMEREEEGEDLEIFVP